MDSEIDVELFCRNKNTKNKSRYGVKLFDEFGLQPCICAI